MSSSIAADVTSLSTVGLIRESEISADTGALICRLVRRRVGEDVLAGSRMVLCDLAGSAYFLPARCEARGEEEERRGDPAVLTAAGDLIGTHGATRELSARGGTNGRWWTAGGGGRGVEGAEVSRRHAARSKPASSDMFDDDKDEMDPPVAYGHGCCLRHIQLVRAEHAAACAALCWLVGVSVAKTILTKLVFVHVGLPVAFSFLSCVITAICLVPILLFSKPPPIDDSRLSKEFSNRPRPTSMLRLPTLKMLAGLVAVSVAIMLDLACTNVALSLISVALQQSIKSTSPTATMLIESIHQRTCHHPVMWLVVALLCVGPILTSAGSSQSDVSVFGIIMMVAAVLSGAFKYVYAHAAMKTYKNELGTLGFLFWIEIIVAIMLVPWAIANGEAAELMVLLGLASSKYGSAKSTGDVLLLLGTAAFGGVRIYTQFAFLKETSATSLSMSNLAIQALSIMLSIIFFAKPMTMLLGLGVSFTIIMSSIYAYLKIMKIFELSKPEHSRVEACKRLAPMSEPAGIQRETADGDIGGEKLVLRDVGM
ncbi:MAG: hypothetical protein SGPRY_004734, partial [Prymnesium sp.]